MQQLIIVALLAFAISSSLANEVSIRGADNLSPLLRRKLTDFGLTAADFPFVSSDKFDDVISFFEAVGALDQDKSLTCYNEKTNFGTDPRAMPFYAGRGDNFKTQNQCIVHCLLLGHPVSAQLENDQCFCGERGDKTIAQSYGIYGTSNACNCQADGTDLDDGLMCVTELKIDIDFEGCYRDNDPRILPIVPNTVYDPTGTKVIGPLPGQSLLSCGNQCYAEGYQYFGRQWNEECWCGSGFTIAHYGEIASTDSDYCDCDGDNIGSYTQCVYKVPDDKYEDQVIYLGCYKDNILRGDLPDEGRALPVQLNGNVDSIDECARACKESFYDLFAVQFEMECFCGNSLNDDPYKYGASTDCDCDSVVNVGFGVFCMFAISEPYPSPSSNPSASLKPSASPSVRPSGEPTSMPSFGPSGPP